MKTELIEKLEGLLAEADISVVAARIKTIQREYEQHFQKGLEKARQEFMDEGGKTRDFVYTKTEEDEKIIVLLEKFRKMKKEADAKVADEQKKNLQVKKEIVKEIQDITQMSVNVGTALKKLNELQAKWKNSGAVSPHDYKDLQSDYSKAVENFNYNLNIYRALQEHDLKKNHELKAEILEKIKRLEGVENIRDVERQIKIYRNEWEEVGPVENDKWEALKAEFKAVLEIVYARVKSHYKSREEESEKNLDLRKEISAKAEAIATAEYTTEEEWQKKTEEVIALQKEWQSIGKADQKKADSAWAIFRGHCDSFFEKKKVFYGSLKEKFAEVRKQKLALIEEAEKIQSSTEWKETSEKLVQLQNRWKRIPSASVNEEHRLFFRFRKACNVFFESKRAHYDAVDDQYSGNLKIKEELLEKLNAYQHSGDLAADKNSLKVFTDEWNAAGLVPFKEKKRINDAFFQKMDELFEKLNMTNEEKAVSKFTTKIERLAASEGADTLLLREMDHFKKQIEEITGTILNYENNLGFFKHAKTKNAIMLDIEAKIEVEKGRIAEIKKKQNVIKDALKKWRESQAPVEKAAEEKAS
ncbi:MAG: DUF349 domain-containing protein [Bacteroidia bacterium]|nr:DUF349 domain-containing protein [Bacteroidia bacterium]